MSGSSPTVALLEVVAALQGASVCDLSVTARDSHSNGVAICRYGFFASFVCSPTVSHLSATNEVGRFSTSSSNQQRCYPTARATFFHRLHPKSCYPPVAGSVAFRQNRRQIDTGRASGRKRYPGISTPLRQHNSTLEGKRFPDLTCSGGNHGLMNGRKNFLGKPERLEIGRDWLDADQVSPDNGQSGALPSPSLVTMGFSVRKYFMQPNRGASFTAGGEKNAPPTDQSITNANQRHVASNTDSFLKSKMSGSETALHSPMVSRRALLSLPLLLCFECLWRPLSTRAADAMQSSAENAQKVAAVDNQGNATTRISGEIRSLLARAQRLEDQGKVQEAFATYSAVIEQEPGLVWAYANRANLHSRQGQYREALDDYTRAIRLLCQTVSSKELDRGAKLIDDDAPCLGRELWVLYLNRGTVYRTLRRKQEALRDLNRALSIRPYEPLLLVNRAMIYVDQAKYDAALLDYQRAVERRPSDVQPFWVDYALTLFQRGRDTDALGIMRRVASKPSFAQADEVKAAFAVILYDRGMLSDAEGLWGALERPRRFQDENFLRNERHWPPRAIEVALRYHPLGVSRPTSATSTATSMTSLDKKLGPN
jgi:tetratricopeptide (TPR) repeat protein